MADARLAPIAWKQGENLAGYRCVRELARAGAHVVFEAEEARTGMRVAVKLTRVPADGRGRIAETLAALAELRQVRRHPSLVTPLGEGLVENAPGGAIAYAAFELLEGISLRELTSSGSLKPRQVARVAWQLAQALDELHAVAMIHGAVTPGNVLVVGNGRIVLTEPVRCRLHRAHGPAAMEQPEGERYRPPDAVTGKGLDARSDVYSLGCVLWRLLSGDDPGGEEGGGSFGSSAQEARTVVEKNALSGPLREIVFAAMHLQPTRRPANPLELAERVDKALADEPFDVPLLGPPILRAAAAVAARTTTGRTPAPATPSPPEAAKPAAPRPAATNKPPAAAATGSAKTPAPAPPATAAKRPASTVGPRPPQARATQATKRPPTVERPATNPLDELPPLPVTPSMIGLKAVTAPPGFPPQRPPAPLPPAPATTSLGGLPGMPSMNMAALAMPKMPSMPSSTPIPTIQGQALPPAGFGRPPTPNQAYAAQGFGNPATPARGTFGAPHTPGRGGFGAPSVQNAEFMSGPAPAIMQAGPVAQKASVACPHCGMMFESQAGVGVHLRNCAFAPSGAAASAPYSPAPASAPVPVAAPPVATPRSTALLDSMEVDVVGLASTRCTHCGQFFTTAGELHAHAPVCPVRASGHSSLEVGASQGPDSAMHDLEPLYREIRNIPVRSSAELATRALDVCMEILRLLRDMGVDTRRFPALKRHVQEGGKVVLMAARDASTSQQQRGVLEKLQQLVRVNAELQNLSEQQPRPDVNSLARVADGHLRPLNPTLLQQR